MCAAYFECQVVQLNFGKHHQDGEEQRASSSSCSTAPSDIDSMVVTEDGCSCRFCQYLAAADGVDSLSSSDSHQRTVTESDAENSNPDKDAGYIDRADKRTYTSNHKDVVVRLPCVGYVNMQQDFTRVRTPRRPGGDCEEILAGPVSGGKPPCPVNVDFEGFY